MADTALIFPGQGSQTDDMRELVERHEPGLLELAIDEVGEDPFERTGDGTAFAQPAILAASIASWTAAGRPAAPLLAGHSLGELSALAVSGAIEPADALRLAVVRGRLMQEAAGEEPGGMIALLGDPAEARGAAETCGLVIANDNGPTQLVAAGSLDALEAVEGEAKARGVRTMRLPVRGAFHSPAMEVAVVPFRNALAQVDVASPEVSVYASSAAAPFGRDADAIRDRLAVAIASPVRWRETLEELYGRGVRAFVEAGPGKALTGMVRRAFGDVEAKVLSEPEGLRLLASPEVARA